MTITKSNTCFLVKSHLLLLCKVAVIRQEPYAASLSSWDYAIIIADKGCLHTWHGLSSWSDWMLPH